jgi:hypothetical protein
MGTSILSVARLGRRYASVRFAQCTDYLVDLHLLAGHTFGILDCCNHAIWL